MLVGLAAVLATLGLSGLEPARITYTYSVAASGPVAGNVEQFAAFAATTYSDLRGWTMNGQIRFARVPAGGDFTLWLATPERMGTFSPSCTSAYSCRAGRNVVINDARWTGGPITPGWRNVDDYRTMVINHETGHWLGLGHTYCSTPGAPATVMQQQSKSLQGCAANPYPTPPERTSVAGARGLTPDGR